MAIYRGALSDEEMARIASEKNCDVRLVGDSCAGNVPEVRIVVNGKFRVIPPWARVSQATFKRWITQLPQSR